MAGIEITLLERLHQVGQRAGITGLLDQLTLRECGDHQHRSEAFTGDVPRRRQPVEARHLDVEDHQIRPEVAHQLDGFVAPAGLADDVIALLLEELLQVEADDRFVFGDHHAGRACGLSGHGGSRGSTRGHLGRDAIEQRVLFGLEFPHRRAQGIAVTSLRIGVPAGVAGFDVGEGRLGHQGAQPHVFGLLFEEHELLLGDRELSPDPFEPFADVDQTPLQD